MSTPLMQQYNDLKKQAGNALLLFRMGDFYELFGDDAVVAAKILEITLTSRDKGKPDALPMAGVPHHSAQGYIQRLLKAGKKVAIAEQTGEATGRELVKREIVRTFTPGIQFDIEGNDSLYVAGALNVSPNHWIAAALDASTGELVLSPATTAEDLRVALASLSIRHWFWCGTPLPSEWDTGSFPVEEWPVNAVLETQAPQLLKRQYGISDLQAYFGNIAPAHTDSVIRLVALLVHTVARTQNRETLDHLQPPRPLIQSAVMKLGPGTVSHLDLLPQPSGAPSLFEFINRTSTAMGARLLKRRLLEPSTQISTITERQAAIQELFEAQERVRPFLSSIYDLERLLGRITTRLAHPRDLAALGVSLNEAFSLARALATVKSPLLKELSARLNTSLNLLEPLNNELQRALSATPPLTVKEGGIFARGYHAELDRLLNLAEHGTEQLVSMEQRERNSTGISSLKIKYNRVFGYSIEITSTHLKNVPAHYIRKQTMAGAERFITEELKRFEDELLNATTKQKALEFELFSELLQTIHHQAKPLQEVARVVAEVDVYVALGRLYERVGWVTPVFIDQPELSFEQCRHPLLDERMRGGFVPNSVNLCGDTRTLLITGPNMGGKSTVMRQVALLVILAHLGAPVPAHSARLGVVHALYTRIGAQDAIASGQSTFMVEMSELAHILHYADERSLLVLDEIGRGTSTYDGMSVAWATLEHLCQKTRARTLFATHYHELTRLSLPGLSNAHMAVASEHPTSAQQLRFLYELRPGPANESYGVQVAALAGVPSPVVKRAQEVLSELERHESQPVKTSPVKIPEKLTPPTLPLFSFPWAEGTVASESELRIIKIIRNLKIDHTTPLQALQELQKWQWELSASSSPELPTSLETGSRGH